MKTEKLDINEQELNLLHIGRHKVLKGGNACATAQRWFASNTAHIGFIYLFICLSNLVYNSDFIVCTDKTRICFNISRKIFVLWWAHGMYCL